MLPVIRKNRLLIPVQNLEKLLSQSDNMTVIAYKNAASELCATQIKGKPLTYYISPFTNIIMNWSNIDLANRRSLVANFSSFTESEEQVEALEIFLAGFGLINL